MPATTRITRATIEAAWKRRNEPHGQRIVIRDSVCPGLALVVGARSASWLLTYKPRGSNPQTGRRWATQSITIGTVASHGPEAARDEAARLKMTSRDGNDPAAERRERIRAASDQRSRTASAVLERYAAALPHRASMRGTAGKISCRYATHEIRFVRQALVLMNMLDRPLAEIEPAAISRMLAALAAHPGVAWHAGGALHRFFDWTIDHGFADRNPVLALPRSKRPRPPKARDSYLTPEQIAVLWHAADGLSVPVWRDLVRFLLVVPARAGVVQRLTWRDLDLERAVWNQPGLVTKNGDPHRIHLPRLALEILQSRRNDATPLEARGHRARRSQPAHLRSGSVSASVAMLPGSPRRAPAALRVPAGQVR